MSAPLSPEQQHLADAALLAIGAVHDLRNLLVALLGNTELVLDDARLNPELRSSVSDAHTAAKCAAALTDQLLQFVQKGALRHETVPVSELVDVLQPLVRVLVPSTTRVRWHVPAQLPSVRIDRGQFTQLAINLLTNAIEATSGQPNWIELSLAEEPGAVDDATYVRFAVRDTGAGIAPENLGRIFDSFFTTRTEGLGIGLFNVRRIAELHGGSISVQSELGRGSTFSLRLPAVPTSVAMAEASA